MYSALVAVWQPIRQFGIRQRSLRYANRLDSSNAEMRLDLGCGSSKRSGFVGIDLTPEADIQWDIRWGIPFADKRVLEIRSDHFFEHLELSVVVKVFRECRRVLVPGGMLDFTIPHFDPYVDAYLRRDYQFLNERITDIPKGQEDLYGTCFDRISWLLHRAGEHKSLFDRDSIIAKLRVAGFTDVTIREFDPDKDVNWRFSSIYVVAVK